MSEKKRILLVDDEPDLLELLVERFEMEGFEILTAHNGNQAIDVLKNNSVDYVLSDIRMANGTGVDILTYVRQQHPDVPIFFLITGFSDHSEDELLQLGAKAVLKKPFQYEDLISHFKAQK